MKNFSKHSMLLRLRNPTGASIKFCKQNLRDCDQNFPLETTEKGKKTFKMLF